MLVKGAIGNKTKFVTIKPWKNIRTDDSIMLYFVQCNINCKILISGETPHRKVGYINWLCQYGACYCIDIFSISRSHARSTAFYIQNFIVEFLKLNRCKNSFLVCFWQILVEWRATCGDLICCGLTTDHKITLNLSETAFLFVIIEFWYNNYPFYSIGPGFKTKGLLKYRVSHRNST